MWTGRPTTRVEGQVFQEKGPRGLEGAAQIVECCRSDMSSRRTSRERAVLGAPWTQVAALGERDGTGSLVASQTLLLSFSPRSVPWGQDIVAPFTLASPWMSAV